MVTNYRIHLVFKPSGTSRVDTNAVYLNSGHWKRIKFQTNTGNNVQEENMLPMTLSDDPEVKGEYNLSQSMIKIIKNWVIKYKDYLSDLADKKIDIEIFKTKLIFDRGLPMKDI
jgi:hypothetical protein